MEDLPGDYVTVDATTFAASRYDVIVVNGKIRSLSSGIVAKYHPATTATDNTIACHPGDILLIVDKNQEHKLSN